MSNLKERILKAGAKASVAVAIRSCGKASIVDTYQPKVPAAVRQLKEQDNAKK